jgi:plastocyanin
MMYVLIMLMWVPTAHTVGVTSSAEFSSRETCMAAGNAAKKVFDGYVGTFYFVCSPK